MQKKLNFSFDKVISEIESYLSVDNFFSMPDCLSFKNTCCIEKEFSQFKLNIYLNQVCLSHKKTGYSVDFPLVDVCLIIGHTKDLDFAGVFDPEKKEDIKYVIFSNYDENKIPSIDLITYYDKEKKLYSFLTNGPFGHISNKKL